MRLGHRLVVWDTFFPMAAVVPPGVTNTYWFYFTAIVLTNQLSSCAGPLKDLQSDQTRGRCLVQPHRALETGSHRAHRFPLNVDLYSPVECSVSSAYTGTDALTHSWEHCSVSL